MDNELKPDLVTMDITMPEMDGIEAVKRIRAMDGSARIIMVSAMGQQGLVLDAISAGSKDFVVKPFQPDRVVQSIKKCCLNLSESKNYCRGNNSASLTTPASLPS
ncbi:CheY-like chemotaxis protein [Paenibacillus phyllosphaerae]|uniref:CheY-like chemotaxis protein n=1 Tax=Paenibacillus phyllosphaerae TaxID=274593 RepID=A0A7W5FPU5_9BACL|nr:CheY-like chemotaxis protein [Paenibacillus phyllosphaerae]